MTLDRLLKLEALATQGAPTDDSIWHTTEGAFREQLAIWFRANKSRLKEREAGDESGWLIEVKHNQFTLWWRGGHDPWANYGEPRWTRDAFKAVRFCRKEDAEAVITAWGAAVPNAFPTSHGFFAARKET